MSNSQILPGFPYHADLTDCLLTALPDFQSLQAFMTSSSLLYLPISAKLYTWLCSARSRISAMLYRRLCASSGTSAVPILRNWSMDFIGKWILPETPRSLQHKHAFCETMLPSFGCLKISIVGGKIFFWCCGKRLVDNLLKGEGPEV